MIHVVAFRTGGRAAPFSQLARHTDKIDLRTAGPQVNKAQAIYTFLEGALEHSSVKSNHTLEIMAPYDEMIETDELHCVATHAKMITRMRINCYDTSMTTERLVILILVVAVVGLAFSPAIAQSFTLSSSSFKNGGEIPSKFTCEGADTSPALKWSDPPKGTQSFALVADDPDAPAGTWVHWVIYNIPALTRELSESVPKTDETAGGVRQGVNDFRRVGYGGPCPPPGKPHRYFFKLYALDAKLNLAKATKQDVEQSMRGHILARAELMALYKR